MNIILSIIFLVLIITIKTIDIIKNKSNNKDSILYKKEKQLTITLSIISIVLFIISFLLNKYLLKLKLLQSIINTLILFVLSLPISIHNLYNSYINNEEKSCYIKTIITNKEISKTLLKKINQAHINIVLISSKENKLELPIYKKNELNIKTMRQNIVINSRSIKNITDEYNEKMNFIYSLDPEDTYSEIINARGICDNYIRTIKYNFLTYLPIILAMLFITYVMQFPFPYIISLALLIKLITLITSKLIYKNLPYDTDIPTRKSKDKNIFLYKQEILLLIFQLIPLFIGISLPYTYFIAYGATESYSNTTLFIIIILMNIFLTYVNLSENITIKNFIQIIKNKYLAIYTIFLTLIIVLMYFTNIFKTEQIGIKNIIGCIIVAFIFTVCYDIVKFARFTTTKGKKKNEYKNNKKHRRS